jgi:protein SCO1/2
MGCNIRISRYYFSLGTLLFPKYVYETMVMKTSMGASIILLTLLLAIALLPHPLQAHTMQDAVLPNVGVDEKLGAQLPLDLAFTDQDGHLVRLGDYFTGGPVILTLNYYSCPMLCPLIFRNLSNAIVAIKGVSLERDYRIVTVSIDPDETPARAYSRAEETWRMLAGVAASGKRWPFLFDRGTSSSRLAHAVGVRYTRIGDNNFAHPSVILVLTPSGKVARYLYGIEQRPADLKLALTEAAGGKIGGSPFLNQFLLYCYHYDPVEKKYALAAVNIMKIGGGIVFLLFGVLLLTLWRREKHGPGGAGDRP